MNITHIASFLVSPGKNIITPPEISGTMLPLTGPLHNMLTSVFDKSDVECSIPIRFVMDESGAQNNIVRNYLTAFINNPSLTNGMVIAERMRNATTSKSGPALFFIILGQEGKKSKVVLSRFPADQGIVAQLRKNTLQVEFIERVFMKNAESYKAALYQGFSTKGDYWTGKAVDKQANELANYWIYEFLCSDFETTSKFGTKRFADAMREASRKVTDLDIKRQLLSMANLIHGLSGESVSINGVMERFGLTQAARDAVVGQLKYSELADDVFILDVEEFSMSAAYSTVELDNGGILMAPPEHFNEVFHRDPVDSDLTRVVVFTTRGRIIDEKLKGRR
jgi:hypothetical protein